MRSTHFKSTSAHAQPGFTLIELMIVVVILAILAAIAMPMYSNYITKANVKNAQSDLVALSLLMEQKYQRNLKYTTSVGEVAASSYFGAGVWQASSENFDYKVNVDTVKSYSLKAEGKTGTQNAGCILTLTHKNVRTINGGTTCGGVGSW